MSGSRPAGAQPRRPGGAEERALVQAAAAGDANAFMELARRHQDHLYTFCFRWVGDAAVAEELAVAVLADAWRTLRGAASGEAFAVQLLRLAIPRGRGVRVYRMRRPPRREAAAATAPLKVLAGARDEGARLVRDLSALDEEHRAALLLRDLEQLDDATIGSLLGLSPEAARLRVHRARAVVGAVTRPDEEGG